MGYVEDTLGSGEKIGYEISFHWLWTLFAYIILVVLGSAALALYFLLHSIASLNTTELVMELIPSLVIGFVGLVAFLYMMIQKWTTERVLTDNRFIQKTGWIVRHTEDIRIDRMEEVNLDQSFLGRILDYGDVRISGVGTGHIRLKMIDSPIEFQKTLNDLKVNYSASNP